MNLRGRKIASARPMTPKELEEEGWTPSLYQRATVLVLDDGTRLYASQDAEGNGPGALFGCTAKGGRFQV